MNCNITLIRDFLKMDSYLSGGYPDYITGYHEFKDYNINELWFITTAAMISVDERYQQRVKFFFKPAKQQLRETFENCVQRFNKVYKIDNTDLPVIDTTKQIFTYRDKFYDTRLIKAVYNLHSKKPFMTMSFPNVKMSELILVNSSMLPIAFINPLVI